MCMGAATAFAGRLHRVYSVKVDASLYAPARARSVSVEETGVPMERAFPL